jgi:hypothetical protein
MYEWCLDMEYTDLEEARKNHHMSQAPTKRYTVQVVEVAEKNNS